MLSDDAALLRSARAAQKPAQLASREKRTRSVAGASMRPPLERSVPLSPEEWADEFFSKAPQYRTKAALVEIIRQSQRESSEAPATNKRTEPHDLQDGATPEETRC